MGGMSLPPGFRFHPTDEELVGYYLKRKVDGLKIELEVIPVIDLYKFDPWELPDKSFLPKRDMEWFFFCPRDRKYPNGSRTNRATAAGYWKATGKDRKVVCHSCVCGLRKTLVFYRGRAPSGDRTDWVMHEYRLCGDSSQGSSFFEGAFSLCRVVKKNEQSPKIGEFHGESKAKNVVSSIKKSFSQGIFSSKASTTSEGSSSQANNIFDGSNDSTPITSPSEAPSMMEQGPTVTESDYASLWTSHDMVSDSSKAGDYNSGRIPQEEFYSSVAAWQPFNPMNYPYPSYFTEEINVSDDIDQIRCMSPYAKPMSDMEMFHYDDTEVQRLKWTESNTDINPITDGCESYNLTASPLICRQASGDGSFGELNGLWMKDDNMLIMM